MPNRCTTAPQALTSHGRSYCEFKDNDVVLTCDESQSPDNGKTEMLLDCDARKFITRRNIPGTQEYWVATFNLDRCPNRHIDEMKMQYDGNLVVYSTGYDQLQPCWASDKFASRGRLRYHESGALFLYKANERFPFYAINVGRQTQRKKLCIW